MLQYALNFKGIKIKNLTQTKIIIYVSFFLTLFYNYTFFTNTLKVYPLNLDNLGFLISLSLILISVTSLLLILLSSKYTTKLLLIVVVLISSLTTYFMNSYKIIVDDSMIRNLLQTNINESMDLLSIKQILYFTFLGLLPSFIIYKLNIKYRGIKTELLSKIKTIVILLLLIGSSIFIYSKFYTSFFREHKTLRYSTNPTYWIYSIGNYVSKTFNSTPTSLKKIGFNATIKDSNISTLVILVVGEAARADHFSLNGYKKETNPLLKNEDIIDFSNMYSCGTSTAYSVPCMFSIYTRDNYSYKKGISTQNVLDVLSHTGKVKILWRDNNSDSKGVALREKFEDFKTPKNNTICIEGECRDVGMLVGLDKYIEKNKGKDILIILHQMGDHGPAYYKRYPKKFEKFKPVCETNQLEECTKIEIANAYDNALLYTDYFLSKSINFLKDYDNTYKTALIYMSDHGESLGEKGVYLHGLPYFMAPDAQTHIGSIMWFGKLMKSEIDINKLDKNKENRYSQDNLFHTLLGIFKVKTKVYNQDKDILNDN